MVKEQVSVDETSTSNSAFSTEVVFVTGTVTATPKKNSYGQYDFVITDGEYELHIGSAKYGDFTGVYAGDTITLSGYGRWSYNKYYEVAYNNTAKVYPTVLAQTLGEGTVTYAGDANVTLTVKNGETPVATDSKLPNGTSLTVTLKLADGYIVDSFKVNGAAVDANKDGSYTVVVSGATAIAVASVENDPDLKKVTLAYSGTTTTNMVEGNNAASVGLDADVWTVTPNKGKASNFPGLNKAPDIRLYGHAEGGNSITVSVTGNTIKKITIDFKQGADIAQILVGETPVVGTDGVYVINAASFTLKNVATGTTQVQIKSILISYKAAA